MKDNNNEANEYVLKVMGDEYIIRGKDDPQYLQEVAACIEQAVREVSQSNLKLNKSQISMLAALRIADELQKTRKQYAYIQSLLEDAK